MKEDIVNVLKNILAHKESGISLEEAISYTIADLEFEIETELKHQRELDDEFDRLET
jgi:hypothetical protein